MVLTWKILNAKHFKHCILCRITLAFKKKIIIALVQRMSVVTLKRKYKRLNILQILQNYHLTYLCRQQLISWWHNWKVHTPCVVAKLNIISESLVLYLSITCTFIARNLQVVYLRIYCKLWDNLIFSLFQNLNWCFT